MPADDGVDLGMLQHVAHVERSGDVRRRDDEREDASTGFGGRVEDAPIDPPPRPVRLKPLWLIDLFDLHAGNFMIPDVGCRLLDVGRVAIGGTVRFWDWLWFSRGVLGGENG